jgi:putative copper resistance protein D
MTDALIAARFVHFAAMIVLFGGSLFALYGGPADLGLRTAFGIGIRRLLQTAAILALLSALGWFADNIANMTGDWSDIFDGELVGGALFGSPFGVLWLWRGVLIVVLLVLAFTDRTFTDRRGRIGFAALAGISLAALSLTGHANTPKGLGGVLHQASDAVHLLAAGAWLGGLIALGFVIVSARRLRSEAAIAWVRRAVPHFSRMGYWAAGLVLATGIVNGIILVGSFSGLAETSYGRLLLVKIVLVLGMVGFASANRWRLSPRLTSAESSAATIDPLWRNVAAEQILGLGIVFIVSILGTRVPALYH